MKNVIITPLYYIGLELDKLIEAYKDVTIIITDDVSPIFPLDRREEWIRKCYPNRRDITLDSMLQSDESQEFIGALKTKLKKMFGDEEYRADLFSATLKMKKDARFLVHPFKSPLEVNEGHLARVFTVRCATEFYSYTKPKVKELPTDETVRILPYFVLDGKRHFGFCESYKDGESLGLEAWKISVIYKPEVAMMRAYINTYAQFIIKGSTVGPQDIIGWLDGETYYIVEVVAPTDYNEDFNRVMLAEDADILYVDESRLVKFNIPLMDWIDHRLKELAEEKELSKVEVNV